MVYKFSNCNQEISKLIVCILWKLLPFIVAICQDKWTLNSLGKDLSNIYTIEIEFVIKWNKF